MLLLPQNIPHMLSLNDPIPNHLESRLQSVRPAAAFYASCGNWVDEINALIERHGVWCDGLIEGADTTFEP